MGQKRWATDGTQAKCTNTSTNKVNWKMQQHQQQRTRDELLWKLLPSHVLNRLHFFWAFDVIILWRNMDQIAWMWTRRTYTQPASAWVFHFIEMKSVSNNVCCVNLLCKLAYNKMAKSTKSKPPQNLWTLKRNISKNWGFFKKFPSSFDVNLMDFQFPRDD